MGGGFRVKGVGYMIYVYIYITKHGVLWIGGFRVLMLRIFGFGV